MSKSIALFVVLIFAAGCTPAQPPAAKGIDFSHELPPGTDALRKLSPGQYPDFSAVTTSDLASLSKALEHSLAYLATPSSARVRPIQGITHDRAVASLVALRQMIQAEIQSPTNDGGSRFDAAIKANFDVYQSIGALDPNTGNYTGDVLFTAYFTPTYDASPTRNGAFQYPLYQRPADLVSDATGEEAHRQLPDGSTAPAYTRGQIEEQHVLDGGEFVWLADRFAAYIITVQGSARLRMPDGTIREVGYNGNNGYPYVSPGRQMVADGVIPREQLSLTALRNYFAQHPEAMAHYLTLNPRTVFFTDRPGGPFGSLNQPVTPLASVATDKTIFPRALPVFVVAPLPGANGSTTNFRGMMFDQDTGGAIRAAGRCDIYMGLGEQAGQELNVGQLYYLVLRAGQ